MLGAVIIFTTGKQMQQAIPTLQAFLTSDWHTVMESSNTKPRQVVEHVVQHQDHAFASGLVTALLVSKTPTSLYAAAQQQALAGDS
jgi:hypothetical protein